MSDDKINKLNFIRYLCYREEGYDYYEIEEIYKVQRNVELLETLYDCIGKLEEDECSEVIWYLVTEDLSYAIDDLIEFWNLEEEVYWR